MKLGPGTSNCEGRAFSIAREYDLVGPCLKIDDFDIFDPIHDLQGRLIRLILLDIVEAMKTDMENLLVSVFS